MGAQQLQVFSDSQLIVNQVSGDYQAKDPIMSRYRTLAKELTAGFSCFKLTKVPREENQRADALARIAFAIDDRSTKCDVFNIFSLLFGCVLLVNLAV